MSFRTILVGIIAAVCGTFATAGFMIMYLNRGVGTPADTRKPLEIVVAAKNLDLGQKITAEMLSSMEWYSSSIPPGAFTDKAEVTGKFLHTQINAGEMIVKDQIGDEISNLPLSNGMRAFTIEAKSESTTVGQNLVPGNRVDILWQTSDTNQKNIELTSVRLLQNVKILAVGDAKSGTGNFKSVTLELKPNMDLDLNFAQKNGTLSLSVRHPDDNAGVEPIEETNLQTLFAKIEEERRLAEEAKSKPQPPTAWETIAKTISSRIDDLEKQLAKPVEQPQPKRVAVERIGKGMRAISIETPSESTGVAGLLEPGDRVDLHLTLSKQSRLAERIFSFDQQAAMPTERLIENIEVLAVDTNLEPQGEGEKKSMSRSVTVIVVDGMDRDITRAQEMGTLTLVLRGKEDSEPGVPRTLMTLDDFVTRYEPRLSVVKTPDSILVRTYRGQVADDVTFSNGDNSSKVSGF